MLVMAAAKGDLRPVMLSLPVILFPSVLLSGYIVPVAGLPTPIRPVSYILPMTYGLEASRGVMLRGWALGDMGLQLGALVIIIVVVLVLAMAVAEKRGA